MKSSPSRSRSCSHERGESPVTQSHAELFVPAVDGVVGAGPVDPCTMFADDLRSSSPVLNVSSPGDLSEGLADRAEPCPDAADLALLEAKVAAAAVAAAGVDDEQELAVFMRRPDGAVAAGISGVIVGGCLDLQAMWVDEALRGRGLARELFAEVEGE